MIRFLPLLSAVILFTSVGHGKNLRFDLKAELAADTQKTLIFHDSILIPHSGNREIFTGPYTIRFAWDEITPGEYDMNLIFYGLGPDYEIIEQRFPLKPSENMFVPLLPVKEGSTVSFYIKLLDDTSSVPVESYSVYDTSLWGISNSIHYKTNWIKGSLIDFTWNRVMSYIEFVYDKYRDSYKLSEFEKIDLYFHPKFTGEVYLDKITNYSIQPRSLRIDLVYGHDINSASPLPGCELLMYRQLGYGPRWMTVGMGRYYEDNMLEIRKLGSYLDAESFISLLKNEERIRSDTGRVIAGAFVFWLIQNRSPAEFKRLYTLSTVLDFERKFETAYGYPFSEAVTGFLSHAKHYEPTEGELDYYASLYFGRDNMPKAKEYYEELAGIEDDNKISNLEKLAACLFSLGEYNEADSVYDLLLDEDKDRPQALYMKGEISLAKNEIESARGYFEKSYANGFPTGGLELVSLLTDAGRIDSASSLLGSLAGRAERLLDYTLEKAKIRILKNAEADSLLNEVITRSINSSNKSPHDPRPYLSMGRAYVLLGNYEKAMMNFETSFFLESGPFAQGIILLESGQAEDVLGSRDKAKEYYRKVIDSRAAEYHKSLAKRYLEKAYVAKR